MCSLICMAHVSLSLQCCKCSTGQVAFQQITVVFESMINRDVWIGCSYLPHCWLLLSWKCFNVPFISPIYFVYSFARLSMLQIIKNIFCIYALPIISWYKANLCSHNAVWLYSGGTKFMLTEVLAIWTDFFFVIFHSFSQFVPIHYSWSFNFVTL
jgi:hypothetical protein